MHQFLYLVFSAMCEFEEKTDLICFNGNSLNLSSELDNLVKRICYYIS